ncbi:g6308 [Coccomyxa elongata]
MSWASLKHTWTYGPYTANVEYQAIQLLELKGVASTPWICLQEAEFGAILHNEPRFWATAGAFMEVHAAITATLQLAQDFMAAHGTQKAGGEAAFWAGAVQYVLSLRDALSTLAASAKWDPLQAGLCSLQHEGALAWAFPRPGASLDGRYVWERVQWLAFLLQSTRERIAVGLLLGDTDVALLRQASKLAAGALQLHGEAAPAVRKEALDLQKMIRAAGGDATVLEAAQGPPTAGAGSAEHRDSALSPVLQWACRQDALQPGSMVEVCGEHAPDALSLLVKGPQSAASVSAAWQAASLLANDSTEAALEAWLHYMHACRQQGTDMRLFMALIEGKQSQACQLGDITSLFVTAWHAATRMQDWPVGEATKLMSTSSFLVHVLLQEVGQTGRACSEADDMAFDTDAVPDTPPEDERVGTDRTEIYMRGSVLEAAVSANPRAVAEYAAAALLSMGASDGDGPNLDALFNAMTPALACSSVSARCSVASQVAASVMHLCVEAEAAAQAAPGDDLESRQRLAACIRQVAAAAVLTRQQAFVNSLESALEALQRRPAAHDRSAEDGLLSLREQGACLQHILLCPAPELPSTRELEQEVASGGPGAELQQGCSVSQLLRALQPLCSKYCAACSVAADGASCSDNGPLLPQWLPQQVQASCGGDGLPVLADSLACLCCSWGACQRAPVLDALSELLHDDSCGPTAHGLVSAVDGGLLPWLQSGAEPHQVPEEAWAAQSLQASAEHLLNAMDGYNSSLRGSALQMLLDNLAYRPALPAAFSPSLAQRGVALQAASPELFTAARISVKRLCIHADSLPASQAALLHLAACCLAAIRHHNRDNEKGVLSQRCVVLVTCLHEMAVAAPHILCRLDSYPALLEQLVSLACPDVAQQSSAAVPANDGHCIEGRAVHLAAVSSMCALAAHDEVARKVYVRSLLPKALAAPSSHEFCWQAVLAGCSAVLTAVRTPSGVQEGEHAGISVRDIVRSLIKNESVVRAPTAEGPVMDARRLCRLMQFQVCS